MEVTKTHGSLHFSDLGWERFESLALGIVFKWRRWESINHTGVAGDDGGVDIEAVELLENGKSSLHHFQCKRYKEMTNSVIKKMLDDYCENNPIKADRYILITACSLTANQLATFKTHAKDLGFTSVAAWTKSELEAMLFTQYHDLLYIYFGVSVSKQRSNRISAIRRNISLKHKMKGDFFLPWEDWNKKYFKEFGEKSWPIYRFENPQTKFISSELLIRSIDDNAYPRVDLSLPRGHEGFFKAEIIDFYHNGIIVYAYPFVQDITIKQLSLEPGGGFYFQRLRADVLGYIPFNNIIDYDIEGDEYYAYPHLFCDYANGTDPFEYIRYGKRSPNFYTILEDEEVAEISKSERQEQIDLLFSNNDNNEYDNYQGEITCADCSKIFSVDKDTNVYNGGWRVQHVVAETLEISEPSIVCFDCSSKYGITLDSGKWDELQTLMNAIERTSKYNSTDDPKHVVKEVLRKFDTLRKDTPILKTKIAHQLTRLTGVADTCQEVEALIDWFKNELS